MESFLAFITVFVVVVFLPDCFLIPLRDKLKDKIGPLNENKEWRFISRILGWVERSLYGVAFIFFETQFLTFVGLWLTFKAIGSFNTWQPEFEQGFGLMNSTMSVESRRSPTDEKRDEEFHRRRANYMVFVIITGLSLLWVVIVGLIFKHFFNGNH